MYWWQPIFIRSFCLYLILSFSPPNLAHFIFTEWHASHCHECRSQIKISLKTKNKLGKRKTWSLQKQHVGTMIYWKSSAVLHSNWFPLDKQKHVRWCMFRTFGSVKFSTISCTSTTLRVSSSENVNKLNNVCRSEELVRLCLHDLELQILFSPLAGIFRTP